MLKKLIAVFMLAVLLLSGCTRKLPPEIPNTMPPSVMIDGQLYRSTGKQLPAEVDHFSIAGSISEVLPGSEIPSRDGQSNFGEPGMEYAFTQEGLLILLSNEWTLFEPVNEQ